MEIILISVATALNIIVVISKLKKKRFFDSLVDVASTATLGMVFGGTLGGMTIAMISGALVTGYLWFKPLIIPQAFIDKCIRVLKGTAITLVVVAIIVFIAERLI